MKIKYNINTKAAKYEGTKIVLNAIENTLTPYATHFMDKEGNLHHGGYFASREDAIADYNKRA